LTVLFKRSTSSNIDWYFEINLSMENALAVAISLSIRR